MKYMTSSLLAMLMFFCGMTQAPVKTDSVFFGAIDSVLQDFPQNLRNIAGDTLLQEGEVDRFASKVKLPGALTCIISRYHSNIDTTPSWQAKMYEDEDYSKAADQYHRLFRLLKKCYVQLSDGSIARLEGEWEAPREDVAFASSSFHIDSPVWRYRKVKVDIELVYRLSDWVVNINIMSKEEDDKDWSK